MFLLQLHVPNLVFYRYIVVTAEAKLNYLEKITIELFQELLNLHELQNSQIFVYKKSSVNMGLKQFCEADTLPVSPFSNPMSNIA
jgi:hypothetical protein